MDTGRTKLTKAEKIIVILIVLIALSTVALAARLVYLSALGKPPAVVVVPDNLIGKEEPPSGTDPEPSAPESSAPTEDAESPSAATGTAPSAAREEHAPVISLYKGQGFDSEAFQAVGLLPGDRETKYFALNISHSSKVTVYFRATVTEQTKSLAEALHIKITQLDADAVLYSGPFAEMTQEGYETDFAPASSGETLAYYKIEVSMPTSAGNEYQAARLLADFTWFVGDTDTLEPPKMGDSRDLLLYLILTGISAAAMGILLFARRRKEVPDGKQEAR